MSLSSVTSMSLSSVTIMSLSDTYYNKFISITHLVAKSSWWLSCHTPGRR